jgi:hypothetical protein
MSQVVERDFADLRLSQRLLVAPPEVGVVEDVAGMRVTENEVVVGLVGGALEVALKPTVIAAAPSKDSESTREVARSRWLRRVWFFSGWPCG